MKIVTNSFVVEGIKLIKSKRVAPRTVRISVVLENWSFGAGDKDGYAYFEMITDEKPMDALLRLYSKELGAYDLRELVEVKA
jgi:hypothetical protein